MKLIYLALGLCALGATANGQQAGKYNQSVFAHYNQAPVARTEAAIQTVQQAAAQFPGWHVETDKLGGSFRNLYGQPIQVPGGNMPARAQYLMQHQLQKLGVDNATWQQTRNNTRDNIAYVSYKQYQHGHEVAFSRLDFRFTAAGKLQRVHMQNYGLANSALTPALAEPQLLDAVTADIKGATITAKNLGADWVWFPVPQAKGYDLQPAWPFMVTGTDETGFPLQLTGYVDAVNGAVLYRSNEVVEAFEKTIKGNVFVGNTSQPLTDEPLANLIVTIGSTDYYTNDTGLLDAPTLTAPINATIRLEGLWSRVVAFNAGNVVPSVNETFNATGGAYIYPPAPPAGRPHINAYYHVNKMHDFMKPFMPGFTGLDESLTTNVDITTNSCNAFYNGNSINFYAAAGNCNSFAEINDIVYHEYGHGINGRFYTSQGLNGMSNGGLNEGYADIWGISVTDDPVLGRNAYVGGGYIRVYNDTPKVYPEDIQGEVHADGEIIAGAWWDTRLNIGSLDTMTRLFAKSLYDLPNGPNGTEGVVFHDVLISALLADDEWGDNDITNGSPHFEQIVAAFARHGLYLLGDATITHADIPHPAAGVPIDVTASLTLTNPTFFNDLKLFYRVRGTSQWDSVSMVNGGGFNFTGQIPAQTAGDIVEYYFRIYDMLSYPNLIFPLAYGPTVPTIQANLPYQFGVGMTQRQSVDFESTLPGTWTIGGVQGDNATAGLWVQEQPNGSFLSSASGSIICQTDADHTTGTGMCLVTGNAGAGISSINAADVDNGTTTAMTEVFDLTGYTTPVVEYYRWYGNDLGSNRRNDLWNVQIRSEGSSIWKFVDRTYQSDYSWRRRIFKVSDYLNSSKIQLRFIAADQVLSGVGQQGQSTVEAAVDDIFIYDLTPAGVDNTVAKKAAIYPNPAHTELTVQLAQAATGSITLYDLTGRSIARMEMAQSKTSYTIATASLAPGTYMVVVQTGSSIQAEKITVQH